METARFHQASQRKPETEHGLLGAPSVFLRRAPQGSPSTPQVRSSEVTYLKDQTQPTGNNTTGPHQCACAQAFSTQVSLSLPASAS